MATETREVEVKSAWASKINWTQAVSLIATLLALKGVNLDPQMQVQVVVGIQAAQALATWIIKTWFTPTVTAASVDK